MTRRSFNAALAAAPLAFSSAAAAPTTSMGVGSASLHKRSGIERRAGKEPNITETLTFIEYCRELGAGGVQVGLSELSSGYSGKVRKLCESYGMYFEASGRLPRDESEIGEFRDFVRASKNAGASVIRTVLFSGRRYEDHDSYETFELATKQAWKMVTLAEPTLRKERMKIGIENHKNFRSDELIDVMRRIQSEYVGVTVDFGNNYVLMEDPVELAQAFAPYAVSSHIKDHLLQEYEDGFLLYDAPLGEGMMDVAGIVRVLKTANPRIKFTLETMSRDALKVPYLTGRYWATFRGSSLSGRDLAKTLAAVKRTQPKEPLPKVDHLSPEEQIRIEHENIQRGLAYGREKLGL